MPIAADIACPEAGIGSMRNAWLREPHHHQTQHHATTHTSVPGGKTSQANQRSASGEAAPGVTCRKCRLEEGWICDSSSRGHCVSLCVPFLAYHARTAGRVACMPFQLETYIPTRCNTSRVSTSQRHAVDGEMLTKVHFVLSRGRSWASASTTTSSVLYMCPRDTCGVRSARAQVRAPYRELNRHSISTPGKDARQTATPSQDRSQQTDISHSHVR
jgi:hypothetical protein